MSYADDVLRLRGTRVDGMFIGKNKSNIRALADVGLTISLQCVFEQLKQIAIDKEYREMAAQREAVLAHRLEKKRRARRTSAEIREARRILRRELRASVELLNKKKSEGCGSLPPRS